MVLAIINFDDNNFVVQLRDNIVESDLVGQINIAERSADFLSLTEVVGWNFATNTESSEKSIIKTTALKLVPKVKCDLYQSGTVSCASIVKSEDILDLVSIIRYLAIHFRKYCIL